MTAAKHQSFEFPLSLSFYLSLRVKVAVQNVDDLACVCVCVVSLTGPLSHTFAALTTNFTKVECSP